MAQITGEKNTVKMPHSIIMEERKKLIVSGVRDVDSFDEQSIVAYTDLGELTIRGQGLQIAKLSVETGELNLTGKVYSLVYTDDRERSGGFFSRLFK